MFEEMWEAFARTCFKHATSQEELRGAKQLFYAGGIALMSLLVDNPSKVKQLQAELEAFTLSEMTRIAGNEAGNVTVH